MIRVVSGEHRADHARTLEVMHRQRKAVFIDRLGWALPATGGLEIDAYDGPEAIYLLSMEGERLLSSARLLPTTRPHLMSEHFAHLCTEGVPRGTALWEASRFCIDPAILDRQSRRAQLWRIIAGILETGLARGMEQVTFVASHALLPLALDAGWAVRPIGPTLEDGSGRVTAVAADITPEGLAALRARHKVTGPVCRPAARRAA